MSGNNNKSSIFEINRQRFITRARGERERHTHTETQRQRQRDRDRDRQTERQTDREFYKYSAVNRRHQLIQQSVIKALHHQASSTDTAISDKSIISSGVIN